MLYDEYNPIYGNPNTKLVIAWQKSVKRIDTWKGYIISYIIFVIAVWIVNIWSAVKK